MDWTLTWLTVQAIATCVLAVGVVFAFYQLRQTRRSTNAQISIELFHELRNEETKDILRFVYQLRPGDIKKLRSTDLYRIKSLLDKLDLLGCLVKRGIINELLAIEEYGGGAILKCWYQLREYIKGKRLEQGIYCKYVEYLARRAVTYQLKNEPRKEWIRFWRGSIDWRDEYSVSLVNVLRREFLSSRLELYMTLIIRCFNVKRLRNLYGFCRGLLHLIFYRRAFPILRFALKT